MEFNSEDIGWPEDTVRVTYGNDLALLMQTVMSLEATGHIFVVSPKHHAIAMSRDGARAIGIQV